VVACGHSILFPSIRGVDAVGGRGVLADWLIHSSEIKEFYVKKVKTIIFLLIFLCIYISNPLSSDEKFSNLELEFMALNRIIYDYFSQSDTTHFKADSPYIVNLNNTKLLLFNAERDDQFEAMTSQYNTNNPVQYKTIGDGVERTESTPTIDLINYTPYLKDITNAQRIELLIYLTQQLYILHLKSLNKEAVEVPIIDYPVANEENIVLSTFEFNILMDAYYKTLYPQPIPEDELPENTQVKQEVIELLKQFYAIRIKRWKAQDSQIQSYEISQEKILGLSFYQAYKLLTHLEGNPTGTSFVGDGHDHPVSLTGTSFIGDGHDSPVSLINAANILHYKLYSTLQGSIIGINSITRNKAENIGFLLIYLYNYLGWEYSPETATVNFHAFLGNQLDLKTTQIDSLYAGYLQQAGYKYLVQIAKDTITEYLEEYNSHNTDYNIKIAFRFNTDDIFFQRSPYYINQTEKSIIFPNIDYFRLHTPDIDIDILQQTALFHFERRDRHIKTTIPENAELLVITPELNLHLKIADIAEAQSPLPFTALSFNETNISFATFTPGVINFTDGMLEIRILSPTEIYNIEDEYLETIEELNEKLIKRGVPTGWLAQNINNPNFKVYHNVVKFFTNMPEHQVSRGERDQDWYMRNFGVDEKIRKGAYFRQTHLTTLQAAEKKYGIHYELMMAIMAIETDYANPRWKGTYYTFPTLVSQYILLPRRQRFAVSELYALYQFSNKTEKETYHYIGSFAGAAGWGQFIPSSMNTFYVDANDNVQDIDIYSIDDTIFSIANYLSKQGLSSKNMGNYQARYKAVHAYNNSDAYVKAVLYIYDKLHTAR